MPLTEKAASYTELDKAIALANAVVASDYTEDSYNAMATKLAAANAVARDLKISDQAIIDKAATKDGKYNIDQIFDGETVEEVLDYVQYNPKKLDMPSV